jgi:ribonuclease P/MRP protein subunit POP3
VCAYTFSYTCSDQFHLFARPTISPGLQQKILIQLTTLFDGVAAHYQLVGNARKKSRLASSSSLKQAGSESSHEPLSLPTSAPPIIPHLTVGINEVTKALETEVRTGRQIIVTSNTAQDVTQLLTRVIFICHEDLDTPAIVAHLPQLVAMCNSARPDDRKIKVVQLPAGAQTSLASALGYLKRVSVMALDVSPFSALIMVADVVSRTWPLD